MCFAACMRSASVRSIVTTRRFYRLLVWARPLEEKPSRSLIRRTIKGALLSPVVGKGKGSGFLRDLGELELFLQDICSRSALSVSVKTRVGFENDAEYEDILDLYCRCPLAELIVHPRVRADFYKGIPRQELYGKTLERAPFPVAYNGDIFDVDDMDALVAAYPQTRHVMIGRGLLANPALARMAQGGPAMTLTELKHFHDELYRAYEAEMGGNAVFRMKEWWFYAK